MWLYLSAVDATLVDKIQVSGVELYHYDNNLVVHLEIGGLGSNDIFCPLVLCKECQSVGWDVEPHNSAEEKHILRFDAAVQHPVGAVGPGSRQIVTAKMLHILLQNKCYNLKMLLK